MRPGATKTEWRPPFITTPAEVVERMLQVAETRAGDLVIDLGSGDGRIVIAAAQQFGARGVGIELDPALVEKSRENARAAQVADRVRFVARRRARRRHLARARVVTVYLLPALMAQAAAALHRRARARHAHRVARVHHGRLAARPQPKRSS